MLSGLAIMAIFGEPVEGSLYHLVLSIIVFSGWILMTVSMYKDRQQVSEVTDWEPWPSTLWFAAFAMFAYMGGLCGLAYWSKRYQNVNVKQYRET
jgi:hypothetical protein